MISTSSAVTLIAALTTIGLMAGCCSSQNCAPCEPLGTNDVRVAFRTDTLSSSGFSRVELRDAYLVRYASRDLTGATDTIRQGTYPGREPLDFYGSSFGFRQLPPPLPQQPTSGPTTSSFIFNSNDFSYRVMVPATGQQFTFSELETAVDPGKGCCACLIN